jgi:uncharacterized protein YuzE
MVVGSIVSPVACMTYFEKDDVLHLAISDEPEAGSVELSPNITAELNDKGEMIGIEILEASRSFGIQLWNRCRQGCCVFPSFNLLDDSVTLVCCPVD